MAYLLADRAVISVTGKDSQKFLQGLLTQDIKKAGPLDLMYSLMLTPQGKILYDFFILQLTAEEYLLDCPASYIEQIIKAMQRYRLRSEVQLEDVSARYGVYISVADEGLLPDPRHSALGGRSIRPRNEEVDESIWLQYHQQRIALGIVDYQLDLVPERFFPLELGMEQSISYDKGCYVGQEVTARTHYSGTIRKKLYPVVAYGQIQPHQEVMQEERDIGKMLGSIPSVEGSYYGLALLRSDLLSAAELMCDGVVVRLA